MNNDTNFIFNFFCKDVFLLECLENLKPFYGLNYKKYAEELKGVCNDSYKETLKNVNLQTVDFELVAKNLLQPKKVQNV